ncbi:MAG: hypothetical protein ACT4TC_11300 [Myxococcaceae bacterium]
MWAPLSIALAVALSASPKAVVNNNGKTQLKIEVQPSTAVLYVDGKRAGTGGKKRTLTVTPGAHRIRVVNHQDEHQEMVSVKKGEVKVYTWAFTDDRPAGRNVAAKTEDEAGEKQEAATSEPAAKRTGSDVNDTGTLPGEPTLSEPDQNEAALKDAFGGKR